MAPMTKSFRHHDADSCANDFGVPDTLYGVKGQKVGEWELKDEVEKLQEIELDTINEPL